MNEQIVSIWKYLHENDVRYLIIGGFAVNIYGYNRSTGDIDIYIDDTKDNRIRLRKAFKEIGLGDFEELEHIQFLPGWTGFTLGSGLRLDIMTKIMGLEDKLFEELLHAATKVILEGIPVLFIDYYHLIIAKRAANRIKDQLDIEELEKVNKQ